MRWGAVGSPSRSATTVAVSSRSVTSPLPIRSASRAVASPSAMAWRGAVRASAWSTSRAFQAGLSSTAAAPSLLTAWTAATNSTRLEVISATRSPGVTPRSARWWATALAARSSAAYVQTSSPTRSATRSPPDPAARSRPPCRSGKDGATDTETLFSDSEIDVNTSRVYCSPPWSRPAPHPPAPTLRCGARSSRRSVDSSPTRSFRSPPSSSTPIASRPTSSSR